MTLHNQIRFIVMDGVEQIHQTEWYPENTKDDAVSVLTEVRKQLGGDYRYRIERTGDSKVPNPLPRFRYRIHVRKGEVQVTDAEGTHIRSVKDATIQTRPFYESEREKILAELKESFPGARLEEVKL